MSAAARKRIADAVREQWAAIKAREAGTAEAVKKAFARRSTVRLDGLCEDESRPDERSAPVRGSPPFIVDSWVPRSES
jgi:hypothetical protein